MAQESDGSRTGAGTDGRRARVVVTRPPGAGIRALLAFGVLVLVSPGCGGGGDGEKDRTAPQLLGAAATGATGVLASFSEPLATLSVDPTKFTLAPNTVIQGLEAPQIVAADLNSQRNQVRLTTLPLVAGLGYTLTVTGVTDDAGNTIDPDARSAPFAFTGITDGTTLPRVVGAISTSNTSVVVTFSKPMADSAQAPANYVIVQKTVNPEVGTLRVTGAQFVGGDRTAVELETLTQDEVTYVVQVVNVTDLAGGPLAPKQIGSGGIIIDPTIATFPGTPPGVGEFVDSDGDGLEDRNEQRGWVVNVVRLDGTVTDREVTSDPYKADTDGDGVRDDEERRRSMNPRATDTDADTVSDFVEIRTLFTNPLAQDTDGDGFDDGTELNVFKTHPGVADSDGDGFEDFREIIALNRNPRIADLPKHQITVGDVRLQIDERYTYTDNEGRTVSQDATSSATLARSQENRFERSAKAEFEASAQFSAEQKIATSFELKLKQSFGFKGSAALQFTQESTRTAQEAFENSLVKGQELTRSLSVMRQVVGARVDAELNVENTGDIAFSLRNVEITVLAQDERDRTRFLPVATLLPNSTLISGEPVVFNLGPLDPARGPVLFSNRDVFPNLVEGLLRQPRGLIFEVANFDVTDEFGRNFAFASQEVRDRTAQIIIDFGDNEVQRFLVAVNPARDTRSGAGGEMVGTLDASGKSTGIPLDFALQEILGFRKNSTIKDGILAGANRVADTVAAGDDVQLVPAGTGGLPQDAVVVAAGENGILDTVPRGDDEAAVTTGYATAATCNGDTESAILEPETDGNGTADTVARGDDEQLIAVGAPAAAGAVVVGPGPNSFIDSVRGGDDVLQGPGLLCQADAECPGGACNGREALRRVGHRSSGEFRRFWALLVENDVQLGVDFGNVVLRAGDSIGLAFIQDFDRDGLLARQEYLFGSSDSLQDTDADGLEDFAEIVVGWDVGVRGQDLRRVHPDPRFADSDRDGVGDFAESDLRVLGLDPADFGLLPNEAIRTNPERRDTDEDGVRDDEEVFGFLRGIGIVDPLNVIIVAADGRADTAACNRVCRGGMNDLGPCSGDASCPGGACEAATCDDVQVIPVGEAGFTPRTAVVAPGANGRLDTIPSLFDEEVAAGNKVAQTIAVADDKQIAALGSVVGPGGVVVKPGPNGELDSTPGGDDVRLLGNAIVVTNPLDPDTDLDQVPDGVERTLGSDPTDPTDAGVFADTDEDGLTDVEEKLVGWVVTVTDENGVPQASRRVFSNPTVPDTDIDGLPDFVERAILSDPTNADTDGDSLSDFDEFAAFDEFVKYNSYFPGFVLDGSTSKKYGTSPVMRDSDGDGLTDDFELFVGWTVVVPAEGTVRAVHSDPTRKDTDLDGLDDGSEARGTDGELPFTADGAQNPADSGDALDPTDADTDGDGRLDGAELRGVCSGGKHDRQPCASTANCVTGTCLTGPDDGAACGTGAECRTEQRCAGGANDGAACTKDEDCLSVGVCGAGGPNAGKACLTTARQPGEYTLSAECGVCSDGSGPCRVDQECVPEQGTCVTEDQGSTCTADAECSAGGCVGTCEGGDDAGTACHQDADCDSDQCSGRTCGAGNAGASCRRGSDCDSGLCRFATVTCTGARCYLDEAQASPGQSAPSCQIIGGTCARDDAICLTSASDPLVQDISVTVTYRSLVPTELTTVPLFAGTFVWELDVRRPRESAPGARVSSSQNHIARSWGSSDFLHRYFYCGSLPIGPLAPVYLNDSITFPMRKGQVFTIEGRIAQIGYVPPLLFYYPYAFVWPWGRGPVVPVCANQLTPRIADIPLYAIECGISFNEAITFDQLGSAETQIIKRTLRKNQGGRNPNYDCAMEMVVDVDVQ